MGDIDLETRVLKQWLYDGLPPFASEQVGRLKPALRAGGHSDVAPER